MLALLLSDAVLGSDSLGDLGQCLLGEFLHEFREVGVVQGSCAVQRQLVDLAREYVRVRPVQGHASGEDGLDAGGCVGLIVEQVQYDLRIQLWAQVLREWGGGDGQLLPQHELRELSLVP